MQNIEILAETMYSATYDVHPTNGNHTNKQKNPRVCTKQTEQTGTRLPGAFCIKLVSFSI